METTMKQETLDQFINENWEDLSIDFIEGMGNSFREFCKEELAERNKASEELDKE